MARQWGASVVRSLIGALEADSPAEGILHFPNRAAYLARFLVDLVNDRAWKAWHHNEFRGLKMLPMTAAIRTVVLNEPDNAVAALNTLSLGERLQVLNALRPADAGRVLEALVPRLEELQDGESLAMLLDSSEAERKTVLRRLIEKKREQVIPAKPVEKQKANTADTNYSSELDERRYTAFGGAFLLLPLLAPVPLMAAAARWPVPESADKTTLIRLLILAKCMGGERAMRAFNDPVLRDLAAVPPAVTLGDAANWLGRITPEQQHAFLKHLADWRLQVEPSETQLITTTKGPGRVAVLVARRKGMWLAVYEYESPPEGASLVKDFATFIPTAPQVSTPAEQSSDDALPAIGLQSAQEDLSFLTLPRNLCPNSGVDLALSVVAQSVIRDFGYRLPGFAASSLGYLHANFLNMTASLERQAERWVVRLGRPPLNVILNMTGMARATYNLNWRDGPPFALFQEG